MTARRNHFAVTLSALFVSGLALAPLAAWGGSKRGQDDGVDTGAGATKGGPSREYVKACAQGNAKYAARDFAGAAEAFQKAIELDPDQPLGQYLLGEAELATGNLTEADAAWTRASNQSAEGDAALHARTLFCLADLKERLKKWDDARAAWQVYIDWANRFPAANAFPVSGQSRQQAIDAMLKQDRLYEVVRRRIADTKDGGVYNDPSKSPPAR